MNAGTQTARGAPLSFAAAEEGKTQNAGFPVDFQDLCSRAMNRALGIEKASLSTVVSLNSSVLDIYETSLWFAPVFSNLLDLVSQAVACSMELQMNWLTLLAPYALSHVATPDSRVASTSGCQAQPAADELAHSMDIAIGERFTVPGSTVTSRSGGRAQPPTADALAYSMDTAIGARAA
jgi:hypothetical protein